MDARIHLRATMLKQNKPYIYTNPFAAEYVFEANDVDTWKTAHENHDKTHSGRNRRSRPFKYDPGNFVCSFWHTNNVRGVLVCLCYTGLAIP